MNTFKEKFKGYLKSKGLSFTSARINVFNATLAIYGHFSVEDVFLYLRKIRKSTSRATTYRTINLLVDGGFISEIAIYNGRTIYEWVFGKEPHDHLVCIKCGKIMEVHKQKVKNMTKEVLKKNGFYPVNHRITIKGYCNKCQKKEEITKKNNNKS